MKVPETRKLKVYLAKSNECNPEVVAQVRAHLKTYNIDIVEFTGGMYSDKSLRDSEYLIVVPSLTDIQITDYEIGKGLYTQIDTFSTNYDTYVKSEKSGSCVLSEYIYIVSNTDPCLFAELELMTLTDKNNWRKYGEIYTGHRMTELPFEKAKEVAPIVSSTSNGLSKYLLLS